MGNPWLDTFGLCLRPFLKSEEQHQGGQSVPQDEQSTGLQIHRSLRLNRREFKVRFSISVEISPPDLGPRVSPSDLRLSFIRSEPPDKLSPQPGPNGVRV
jgi:hypothetical protein